MWRKERRKQGNRNCIVWASLFFFAAPRNRSVRLNWEDPIQLSHRTAIRGIYACLEGHKWAE
jgi:hypothetical protein